MDQLIALKPESLDDATQVLDMVNPTDYQNLYDLMHRQCNEVRENRDPDAGFMYTATASVQWSHSPVRGQQSQLLTLSRKADHPSQVLLQPFPHTGPSQRWQGP
jgi:hypothetical protein